MSLRFTVLASGSSGNASLIEADGFGLLIDAGLGPRQLASRLAAVGSSWSAVHAVLLTHTHTDHWKDRTLAQLCRRRIPFYCHPDSHGELQTYSPGFMDLASEGLVRPFESGDDFVVAQGLRCRALPLRHDSGAHSASESKGRATCSAERRRLVTSPTSAVGTRLLPITSRMWICWPWSSITTWRWNWPADGRRA